MRASSLRFSSALQCVLPAVFAAGLVSLALPLPAADAAVTAVSAAPAKVAVAATGPASVSVTWRVERGIAEPPLPGNLSSPNLRVMIGGSLAATLAKPLSRSLQGTAMSESLVLRETVQIPEALVYRAVKQGAPLRLVREFFDSADPGSETAELLVTPSGPGSVALAVERLALSFDDDSRLKVLPRGGELRAVAEINTAGVGLLTGQWEVARASTTAGAPVFRPLALVRQGVAGGGRTVITSPPLPAGEEGTNLVRFRILDPDLAFAAPSLQYYVTPGHGDGVQPAPRQLIVAAPRPGETLAAGTRFAWSALAGAEAYRIAFYPAPARGIPADPAAVSDAATATAPAAPVPSEAPLAAAFVAGDRDEAVLEELTLGHMAGGRSYLWQLVAYDANGAVIGSSSLREIRKP
jgi:hypothetical protein